MATPTPKPNSNTTFSTATGAMGVSGAAVILLLGVLNHFKIVLDATQTAALITILGPIVHRFAMQWGFVEAPAAETQTNTVTSSTQEKPVS